ncbi:MAG: V-type ATPase subunit [Planctomycetota bacterium]
MTVSLAPIDFTGQVDYAAAAGRIAALETRFLATADLERLLAAPDEADMYRILELAGYRVPADISGGFEAVVQAFGTDLLALAESLFPDRDRWIAAYFRADVDFLNLKEKAKHERAATAAAPGFEPGGTFDPRLLAAGTLAEVLVDLPADCRRACEDYLAVRATGLLDHYRLIDAFFDGRKAGLLLRLAERTGSATFMEYTRARIDAVNIATVFRMSRRKEAEPGAFLLDGGFVEAGRLAAAPAGGETDGAAVFAGTPYAAVAARIGEALRAGAGLQVVERETAAIAARALDRVWYSPHGPAVVLAHFVKRTAELFNIKRVLFARRRGLDFNAVREHLI